MTLFIGCSVLYFGFSFIPNGSPGGGGGTKLPGGGGGGGGPPPINGGGGGGGGGPPDPMKGGGGGGGGGGGPPPVVIINGGGGGGGGGGGPDPRKPGGGGGGGGGGPDPPGLLAANSLDNRLANIASISFAISFGTFDFSSLKASSVHFNLVDNVCARASSSCFSVIASSSFLASPAESLPPVVSPIVSEIDSRKPS